MRTIRVMTKVRTDAAHFGTAFIAGWLALSSPVHATLKNETWYKRYPSYPPYCSTPEEMKTRAIPPLSTEQDGRIGETRIVHATAVIRHGARTPWSGDLTCWDGYDTDPETSKWDCDLTTFLAPPSPHEVDIENGDSANNAQSDAMFLFRKQYDALISPKFNLRNILNGTCQRGQLLLQGYDQEFANGEHLRNAYVFDGSRFDHDINMRLLDTNDPNVHPYEEPILVYRSDDDQRTLMSGQILLRGLFGSEFVKHLEDTGTHPVIPLHTADRDRDVLDPAESLCPRLEELREDAFSSTGFSDYESSDEVKTLQHFMKEELGGLMDDAIDCLMTTMCTDRKLPDVLNDYGDNHTGTRALHHAAYGADLFERLYNYSIVDYVFHYRYNNAEYAKLAMAPLWAEIMDGIRPIIDPSSKDENDRPPPRTKLALFSGHDTTILPLLATLGPNVWDGTTWAPYASMMIIEIHEIIDGPTDRSIFTSDFAFRLLYNGRVLTQTMDDCPDDLDLCDATVLLDQVAPFAKRERDCALRKAPVAGETPMQHAESLLGTPQGVVLVLTVVVTSAALGGSIVYMYLTGSLVHSWCNRKRRARQLLAEAESAGLQLSMEGESSSSYHDDPPTNGFNKPPISALT